MWNTIEVSEREFQSLKIYNTPIPVKGLNPNDGVVVMCKENGKQELGIYDVEVGVRKVNTWNPQFKNHKNRDLARLNDLLTNPNINTIVINGLFGTGKTSTIMSHAIEGLKEGNIPQLYLSKPHISTGKSYGHLPGELEDKIAYEFKSYYQYFDRFWQEGLGQALMKAETVELEEFGYKPNDQLVTPMVFEYLRGIDISDESWIVLDEAQNTDIEEMATFVSRLGDKPKLIIIGDTSSYQTDRKSVLNKNNSGLSFVQSAYESKPYSAVVEFNTRNHIIRGDRVKHLYDALTRFN